MSDRRFDVSGVQITASVLAAVSGAILASYLGVAGTIIGTAVMSVAGTAGTSIYKHYLGRTARRVRETATVAAAHRAAEWITVGTRTAAEHGAAARGPGQPGAAAGTGGNAEAAAAGADADATADMGTPGKAAAGNAATGNAGMGGGGALRNNGGPGDGTAAGGTGQDDVAAAAARPGWLARCRATVLGWPRWLQLAAVSAMVFVGVIGGISVVEAVAGKPLQTVVWNHKASGTTVGNLVGGRPAHSTRPASPHHTTSGNASPSPGPSSSRTGPASPSPSPSSGSPSPSPSPTTGTSSPPVSSSPSPDPTRTGSATATARAATG